MRTQGATVVAVALFLVAAAPASALTGGFGVAKQIGAGLVPVVPGPAARSDKLTSCHASGPHSSRAAKGSVLDKLGNKAAPVACEQPPRGQLPLSEALRHATVTALAAIG